MALGMSTGNRGRRMKKELEALRDDSDVAAALVDSDINRLTGNFKGPSGTPYEGGGYFIDIKVPIEYPFKPPQMIFRTKIWHPNVSPHTGATNLDVLGSAWSPSMTIKSALLALRSLLSNPKPEDPKDAEVASMFMSKHHRFLRKAREWAWQYAGAPDPVTSIKTVADNSPEERERQKRADEETQRELLGGYNANMVERFVQLGFELRKVVTAFYLVGIDSNGGEEYELGEQYFEDVVAVLMEGVH